MSIREAALALCERYPLTLCDGKSPIHNDWQNFRVKPEHVHNAFQNNPLLNIGLILGPTSGVIDLECDAPESEDDFRELFKGVDVPKTPAYKSKRGRHRLFKWDERLEGIGKAKVLHGELEIRLGANGKSAHSLIPPSTTNDVTREWETSLDECDPAPLPDVVLERLLARNPKTTVAYTPSTKDGRPGDDFNKRAEWGDILGPPGWTPEGQDGDTYYWKRPGKTDDGHSASTGHCKTDAGKDLFYCFSTNAPPFKSGESYDKFSCYALLNHNGNFAVAASELAGEGYGDGKSNDKTKKDPRIVMLEIAKQSDLCCTPERVPVIVGEFNGKPRTFILPDKEFEGILANQTLEAKNIIASTGQIRDTMRIVETKCMMGQERPIYTRVGEYNGELYIDLGDVSQRVLKVTKDDWQVIDAAQCPVLFHRSQNITALPEPVRGGKIEALRPLLNITDEQWPIIVAFMLGVWNPYGDYPILLLHGQAESAKSSAARLIQGTVDPHFNKVENREELFSPPNTEEDLMITAMHTRLIGYDNVTKIGSRLHPALCRLSTGGATIVRKLYTNSGMSKMSAQRPVIITSLHDIMVGDDRQDLRSRTLFIPFILPPPDAVPPTWADYEEIRPGVIGGLLDAAVVALGAYGATTPLQGHRLNDFTRWVVAAEPGAGLLPGTMAKALMMNRTESAEEVLQDPLAGAIREIAKGGFNGSPTHLARKVMAYDVPDVDTGHRSVTSLGIKLNNMSTEMSKVGVKVRKKGRRWEIGQLATAP